MCGICGVAVPKNLAGGLDVRMIERMRDTLHHRGPDDAGIWVCDEVAFGHRRLSIIDVAAGHQPMHTAGGSFSIVYNGEVYNHQQLRAELETQRVRFVTQCDTEAVLQLVALHGLDAVNRLQGMFAFALWDAGARTLCLVRDRLGIKPLYYHVDPAGRIAFASEIKALLEVKWVPRRLNRAVVPDYLANHAPSGEETLFHGIHRLMPGHVLMWRDGDVEVRRWWDIEFAEPDHRRDGEAEFVEQYRTLLGNAVEARLMSDVPLGAFLSGGIDSAAITGLMAGMCSEPVKTFSVGYRETDSSELRYARLVAECFGTEHHEVLLTPGDFFHAVPKLVWHEDEPMAHPSSVALNAVAKLAADYVKVVLTGEGADETVAGYPWHRATVYNMRLGTAYGRLVPAALRRLIARAIDSLPRRSSLRRKLERTFLCLPADIDSLHFDNFAVFSRGRQRTLFQDGFLTPELESPYAGQHELLERVDGESLLRKLLYVDVKIYLHELLMKQDQMSMAASIESRVPFLDHRLVEFTARLPDSMKLRRFTTKYVLRRAMCGILPAEILTRRKMGFPVPIAEWLRGPFTGVMRSFLLSRRVADRGIVRPDAIEALVASHLSGERNEYERIWTLMNFEIWQRLFLDGESIDEVQDTMRRAVGKSSGVV